MISRYKAYNYLHTSKSILVVGVVGIKKLNSSTDIFPVILYIDFFEKEDASFLFWFNFRYDTTNNRIYARSKV